MAYTHDFTFQIGKDGDVFINGEADYSKKGLKSYKITSSSDPLSSTIMTYFNNFMAQLSTIADGADGIYNVSLKKKEEE